jgi:hypothetical protein
MVENTNTCSNTNTYETTVVPEAAVKLIDRKLCIEIAKSTLQRIEEGSYEADGIAYYIKDQVSVTNNSTLYYPPDSDLSQWAQAERRSRPEKPNQVDVNVMECSTLAGARRLRGLLSTTSPIQSG